MLKALQNIGHHFFIILVITFSEINVGSTDSMAMVWKAFENIRGKIIAQTSRRIRESIDWKQNQVKRKRNWPYIILKAYLKTFANINSKSIKNVQ